MVLGNIYEIQYMYNAVIEYIYFAIIFIQAYGPKHLSDLEKHMKFFKDEFRDFINVFNGKDQVDKIGNFLTGTTNIFNIKSGTVHLSENAEHFKKLIYEDFFISKVVDLILRGFSSVQNIYCNININKLINIPEDSLTSILKRHPYFSIDPHGLVTVQQFHRIIGFDDNVSKAVVYYFHSLLQHTNVLTFNDIKLHSTSLLQYGVQNSLISFCVLFCSNIFKCSNNKIRIRKKWKKVSNVNQKIEISTLRPDCLPIALLVYKAFGPFLKNWMGEISHLNPNVGFIKCSVELKDNKMGLFVVRFDLSALKFICDVGNLEYFLSIGDIVTFDADFFGGRLIDAHWKAAKIRVIQQNLKGKKFNFRIDIDEYLENIKPKHDIKQTFELLLLEKDFKSLNNAQSLFEFGNSHHQEIIRTATILSTYDTKQTQQQKAVKRGKEIISEDNSITHINLAGAPIKDDFQNIVNLQPILITNFVLFSSTFIFGEIVTMMKYEGIAIPLKSKQNYEVYFKSEAIFHGEEDLQHLPKTGNIVLLFIPHMNEESTLFVATLVYVLNKEECVLATKKLNSAKDFVVNYFFHKVKKYTCNGHPCCCDLSTNYLFHKNEAELFPTRREIQMDSSRFLLTFKDVYLFTEKTCKNFQAVLNMICTQNLGISESKLISKVTSMILQLFKSFPSHQTLRDKTVNFRKLNQKKYICTSSPLKSKSNKIKATSNDFRIDFGLKERKNLEKQKFISEGTKSNNVYSSLPSLCKLRQTDNNVTTEQFSHRMSNLSCSSWSSYNSCKSTYSDDEIFHSCNSLSEKHNSDSEMNNSKSKNPISKHISQTDIPSSVILTKNCDTSSPKHLDLFKNTSKGMALHSSKNCIEITNKNEKTLKRMQYWYIKQLKLRHIYLFKIKSKKRHKVILPSENNFCKSCQKPLIKTTAVISTITRFYVLLSIENNNKKITLSFPKCIVPQELWASLRLNSVLKITIIPHTLINLSHILNIELYPN